LKAFSEEDLEDMDLAEHLEHVGSHLGAEGVVLAQLDMDSDAYPLVVVAKKDARRLVKLGETAGYGDVALFTGSDLAAMQRERKARAAREAKRNALQLDEVDRERGPLHEQTLRAKRCGASRGTHSDATAKLSASGARC